MQFERRMTVVDSGIFETLDALLDVPFALCSVVTDSEGRAVDYRILRASAHLDEVFGVSALEGRTAREVAPSLEASWIEAFGRVAIERTPMRFTQGSVIAHRDYEVSATPVDPPGCFVVAFRNLTARQKDEAEQSRAVDQAQRLLKELGHRVMNSFASISAILAMEARAASPEGRTALKRVQGRVQALAALYRRLDGAPEMERIEVAGYLAGNVQSFRDAFAAAAGLSVECDLSSLTLSTRSAVPLALIANELLTDATAQALETGRAGSLRVSLHEEEGLCRLRVEHGGGPVAEGSISRGLIEAFAAELGGELAFEAMPEGTRATVVFRA
jgi:two-component sensor histidine kinase